MIYFFFSDYELLGFFSCLYLSVIGVLKVIKLIVEILFEDNSNEIIKVGVKDITILIKE